MMRIAEITVHNPCQDAGQGAITTLQGNNLPIEASISDLNRIMAELGPADREPVVDRQQHLFGNHIREAVAIVKDWAKDR